MFVELRKLLRSDHVVTLITLFTVNTNLLSTLLSISALILFLVFPNSAIYAACTLVAEKTYLNSFLAVLNAREYLSEKLWTVTPKRVDQPTTTIGNHAFPVFHPGIQPTASKHGSTTAPGSGYELSSVDDKVGKSMVEESKRAKALTSNQEDPFNDMDEAQPVQNDTSSGTTPQTSDVQPELPTAESSTTEAREEANPISSSDGKVPSHNLMSVRHQLTFETVVEPQPSLQSPPAAEPHTEDTPLPPQGISSVPPPSLLDRISQWVLLRNPPTPQ
ncbi:hypothetical protein M422DRAFT_257805 [Sphaerobolus stellatus SS14]|uniref:DUF6534 domain-containing protein n=1 Tax=Sphaerobolus stellatus (strain SS14) TaxID=990650 RepID=A0A0C9VN91_SPHS4|nr:hypothetical protein M422DRAFT_257805 [Sphaerobolus stellatus SS14]